MAGRRRPNARLIKIHRSFTVEEVARVLRTHKNTVRNWIKAGLPTIAGPRPTLIHGPELRRFLEARRAAAKRPCPPGHIYCVRCRAPKRPAGNMADYLPITASSGNLRGICPDCGTLMHRRLALAGVASFQADLEVAFPQTEARIGESDAATVNCDSERTRRYETDAQRE